MTSRVLAWSGSAVHGGAEAVFGDICEGLVGKGVDLVAGVAPSDRALHGRLVRAGISVLEAPVQPGSMGAVHLWNPILLRQTRDVIRQSGAGALFINLPSGELGAGPAIVAGGRPTVGLLHVHERLDRLPFRLGGLRTRLAAPALRRFDRVLCVAPNVEVSVAEGWGLDQSRVGWAPLPFPTLPPHLPSRARARAVLSLSSSDVVIVLVGRLSVKQKGHDVLLDAVAALAPDYPNLRVVLVGSGPDKSWIAARITELGLQDTVELAGRVQPATLTMRAADAIVIPSRFEGLPLVALEALALGLRGVASSVDALESLWPRKWLVEPGNPTALTVALRQILATPDRDASEAVASALLRAQKLTTTDPAAAVLKALNSVAASGRSI